MTVRLVCGCGVSLSADAEDPKQVALAARSRGWRRRERWVGGPGYWECPTCARLRAFAPETTK